ncbi:hypothetical protein GX51_03217 [Blastomyces parvus]|uniref:Uncharacterized protein n=1 Tax=Blastomyces parvus TaxID=2060905 RepID=A0A2B7X821_9EURO|nr:hypothetical protein GX51_03217 [Blastomyces parvus]
MLGIPQLRRWSKTHHVLPQSDPSTSQKNSTSIGIITKMNLKLKFLALLIPLAAPPEKSFPPFIPGAVWNRGPLETQERPAITGRGDAVPPQQTVYADV